jgi:thymidine kinase
LQVNARVRAEDRWYGMHTVAVRDSIDALNGIGHAAMTTDPGFREALAAHGYTLDSGTGEITQMQEYVGTFSQRAAQIERNLKRYEAAWDKAHPGLEAGPKLRQRWDHQAWNDARPGKIVPRNGAEINAAWNAELRELGYRDPAGPVLQIVTRPSELDRDRAVATVLARLGKRRSAWNAADVRGEVEQLIAREGVVTDAAVRLELAEDVTARSVAECVPMVDRPGLPEHLRALTSHRVLDVEADLTVRLIDRAEAPNTAAAHLDTVPGGPLDRLDVAQRQGVGVLAGDARLVVTEGAAGAGKTATLVAARAAIEADGHRLVVVTPTRKAAKVAGKELRTRTSSAAWLATQHGWRWDANGTWNRLTVGQVGLDEHGRRRQYLGPKPEAGLGRDDVLLIDEAGMLDQDTAHALLHVADESGARVVLMGDRHQLAAVGRGGVLDMAARFARAEACVELTTVHRFTDPDYADLSLAMRTGDDPGAVFDTLLNKGLVRIHSSDVERTEALASGTAPALQAGREVRVLADTNEQAAQLNTAIREQMIAAGAVDDHRVATTRAGQRVGAGDTVMTRQNSTELDVANREVWTVTGVTSAGEVTVAGTSGERTLSDDYLRRHVQLAYASTVHAAQGETVDASHLLLGEHTGAASAYVGMTRGRDANTVHLVAESVDEARELWVGTFGRDRADLGPAVAAQRVAVEVGRYAPQRPLVDALDDLRAAWTVEADQRRQLNRAVADREKLREVISALAGHTIARDKLDAELTEALQLAHTTGERANQLEPVVDTQTTRYASDLQRTWDEQRPAARKAARIVLEGPGRLGLHHRRVERAQAELGQWADVWRPAVDLPRDPSRLATFAASRDANRVHDQLADTARRVVEHSHPEYQAAIDTARAAQDHARQLERDYPRKLDALDGHLIRHGYLTTTRDPETMLTRTDQQVTNLTEKHEKAEATVAALLREPAIRSQPAERIQTEYDSWKQERLAAQRAARAAEVAERAAVLNRTSQPDPFHHRPPQHGHGIGI